MSGSLELMSITKPKSLGRLPLISFHDSAPSSLRITSQCFCMKSVLGFDGCIAIRCTQCPISAVGFGMYCEYSPLLAGRQLSPPSSLLKTPADEIATYILLASFGSKRMVCRQNPPAPGAHFGPVSCLRRPGSSFQVCPPSVLLNSAASSA